MDVFNPTGRVQRVVFSFDRRGDHAREVVPIMSCAAILPTLMLAMDQEHKPSSRAEQLFEAFDSWMQGLYRKLGPAAMGIVPAIFLVGKMSTIEGFDSQIDFLEHERDILAKFIKLVGTPRINKRYLGNFPIRLHLRELLAKQLQSYKGIRRNKFELMGLGSTSAVFADRNNPNIVYKIPLVPSYSRNHRASLVARELKQFDQYSQVPRELRYFLPQLAVNASGQYMGTNNVLATKKASGELAYKGEAAKALVEEGLDDGFIVDFMRFIASVSSLPSCDVGDLSIGNANYDVNAKVINFFEMHGHQHKAEHNHINSLVKRYPTEMAIFFLISNVVFQEWGTAEHYNEIRSYQSNLSIGTKLQQLDRCLRRYSGMVGAPSLADIRRSIDNLFTILSDDAPYLSLTPRGNKILWSLRDRLQ